MTVAYSTSSSAIRGTGDLTLSYSGGGLAVLFVNTDKNATVTAPSGWTEAPSSPQVTSSTTDNGSQLAVFWRRYGAIGSVTVTDPSTTTDGAFARVLSFSGVEPEGDPFDATAGATSSQTSTSTSTNQFLLDSSGDYNAWTHTANVTGSGGAITHNTTATDADGSGTNGQIQHRITGRSVSCTNTSSIGITPTSYGVPSGSKIVGYTIVYAWRCSEYTTGASSTVRLSTPGGTNNTFTATGNYADTTLTSTFAASTAALDPGSTFTLTFTSALNTGNSSTAAVAVLLDYVRVTFDYVSTTLTFPSLTTANPNTLVIMAASNAYDATAQDSYDITTFANGNLTSVADRGTASSTGTLAASGKTAVGTGFSATAQNIGASTATAGRPHVPVAFWTGAILGTDSLPYSHRGWGIPMNSERQP